jgi:uncharacterized membrane protein
MNGFGGWEPEWLIFWLVVLAILVAIASYIATKIRPKPIQPDLTASQWMTKYEDLHAKGVLSDEEFRTIKTTLSKQLQEESNLSGNKGSNV